MFVIQTFFKMTQEMKRLMPSAQRIFRGQPNIPVGQPILVQPKYNPT